MFPIQHHAIVPVVRYQSALEEQRVGCAVSRVHLVQAAKDAPLTSSLPISNADKPQSLSTYKKGKHYGIHANYEHVPNAGAAEGVAALKETPAITVPALFKQAADAHGDKIALQVERENGIAPVFDKATGGQALPLTAWTKWTYQVGLWSGWRTLSPAAVSSGRMLSHPVRFCLLQEYYDECRELAKALIVSGVEQFGVARDSNSGHLIHPPPANVCPVSASWTTHRLGRDLRVQLPGVADGRTVHHPDRREGEEPSRVERPPSDSTAPSHPARAPRCLAPGLRGLRPWPLQWQHR